MHVILKPTKAEFTHNTDSTGKMETYIKIKQGEKIFQGEISAVKGVTAVWTESYDLVILGDGNVQISVWDMDGVSGDDLVGDTLLNLNQLAKTGNNNAWIDLYYKGKVAGKIWIDVFIVPQKQGQALLIHPMRAELTRDTDTFGKMDPFVKFFVNGNTFNSAVCFKGGKLPQWTDSFLVPLVGNGSGLFAIWELDGAVAQIVGDANINLFSLQKGGPSQIIDLEYHGKKVGVLHIQVSNA